MILTYNILLHAGVILGLPFIIPMILFAGKWRKSFLNRLGVTSLPDDLSGSAGDSKSLKPIWIHALSVGEVISAVPLVSKLFESKNNPIVFSATTRTGYDISKTLLSAYVEGIFYFPYDLLFSVRRTANRIDPALVVIVETDIWPNFLFEMKRRGVPVLLVNARLSDRSFAGYRMLSFVMKRVFGLFSSICAQTQADADRFRRLGISSNKVTVTGNMKFDQSLDPLTDIALTQLKQQLQIKDGRKVIVSGSTHDGEESILLDAFNRLKKRYPELLMIIVPRDPDRADSICAEFDTAGLITVSMKDLPDFGSRKEMDIIVVDVIGLLKKLYALADIAFVGGSLVNAGGHNPLEPAAYSKPVLFGPDMSDFRQIAKMLLEAGGGIRVHDAGSFYEAVVTFLEEEGKALETGMKAHALLTANRGAIKRTVNGIDAAIKKAGA